MKNWLFLTVTIIALCACTNKEQQATPTAISVDIIPKDSAIQNLVLPTDSPGIQPKVSDDTSTVTPLKRTYKPRRDDEGLKSFDERHRKKLEAFLHNKTEQMRIDDSLIAAKRRELQIEDSLKRLK